MVKGCKWDVDLGLKSCGLVVFSGYGHNANKEEKGLTRFLLFNGILLCF